VDKFDNIGSINSNGASIVYHVTGQGYPIAMMHGGPGSDYTSLLPLRPLENSYTLIYYDHRCNGLSSCQDLNLMNWNNLTADAEALRISLGFDKWAILGHSFGGMVALEYALRYPRHLSHLILLNTGSNADWVQINAPRILARRGFSYKTIRAARQFFNGQIKPNQIWKYKFRFIKAYYYNLNFLKAFWGRRSKGNADALIFGFSKLLPGWDVTARLTEIKTPTLIIAGRHDFIFPPEHQAIVGHYVPNSKLEIIEKAGHSAPKEKPKDIMKFIREFVL
jgi:proline iminopeptidase